MARAERMEQVLRAVFTPTHLEVIDESSHHAGHAGAKPEGETHFRLCIRSDAFKGISRVAAHQKIYAVLDGELKSGLHALAIEILP